MASCARATLHVGVSLFLYISVCVCLCIGESRRVKNLTKQKKGAVERMKNRHFPELIFKAVDVVQTKHIFII